MLMSRRIAQHVNRHTPADIRQCRIANELQAIASIDAQLKRFRSGEDRAAIGEIEQLIADKAQHVARLSLLEAQCETSA